MTNDFDIRISILWILREDPVVQFYVCFIMIMLQIQGRRVSAILLERTCEYVKIENKRLNTVSASSFVPMYQLNAPIPIMRFPYMNLLLKYRHQIPSNLPSKFIELMQFYKSIQPSKV
nr:hypothetical transcript [Hymenolepis microstoma]